MTTHEERKQVIVLLNESITAGARRAKACEVLVRSHFCIVG